MERGIAVGNTVYRTICTQAIQGHGFTQTREDRTLYQGKVTYIDKKGRYYKVTFPFGARSISECYLF